MKNLKYVSSVPWYMHKNGGKQEGTGLFGTLCSQFNITNSEFKKMKHNFAMDSVRIRQREKRVSCENIDIEACIAVKEEELKSITFCSLLSFFAISFMGGLCVWWLLEPQTMWYSLYTNSIVYVLHAVSTKERKRKKGLLTKYAMHKFPSGMAFPEGTPPSRDLSEAQPKKNRT